MSLPKVSQARATPSSVVSRLFRSASRSVPQLWPFWSSRSADVENLKEACDDVLSYRSEAAALDSASTLVRRLQDMGPAGYDEFLTLLLRRYGVEPGRVLKAADAYRESSDWLHLCELSKVVEPPRRELIRRINAAPAGLGTILNIRAQLLQRLDDRAELKEVDADFQYLLSEWFNHGTLQLRRVDWDTSASLLEKIKKYEAVHEIANWSDLQRRLEVDRRCFAYFHWAIRNEPLIFIEVALCNSMVELIGEILDPTTPTLDPTSATHAVFFSINNCLPGLRGIPFGKSLIKRVVAELQKELPNLRTFCTLSPIPTFRRWLVSELVAGTQLRLSSSDREALAALAKEPGAGVVELAPFRDALMALCADYLSRRSEERSDPVARFHLGNGARLERLNWLGDVSAKGLDQSFGVLANYLYQLDRLAAPQKTVAGGDHGSVWKAITELSSNSQISHSSLARKAKCRRLLLSRALES